MGDRIWNIRYNAMEISSIDAFAKAEGRWDGGCRDVYFIRMLGRSTAYVQEIEQMDRYLSEQAAEQRVHYQRINSLPRLASPEDVNYYSGCYDNWVGSGRKTASVRVTEKHADMQAVLGAACAETVDLFRRVTAYASASMEKNFAVKCMFWVDQVGKELLEGFRPEDSRKLVLQDLPKKQEYLFACLMTRLGVDVMLLQYQADIDGQLEGLNLSKKTVLGDFGVCTIPEYRPYVPSPEVPGKTDRRNSRSAAARERRPLEVRMAGEGRKTPTPPFGERRTPSAPSGGNRQPVPPAAGNAGGGARRELTFEELAMLASSVVMISVHDRGGKVLGNGSGIMIGEDGYILTNHHVASGGKFYSVRIEDDDRIYKTDEVIKYNSVLDLSVIRIDRKLRPLPVYGGGKKLVRGQKVVAIGSPLGLFNSVSDGIISGFRVFNDVDMIQFTAPISHGSSGGAVLNMYGEVIGISTAGIDSGQNINLAVGHEFITQFVRGFTGRGR